MFEASHQGGTDAFVIPDQKFAAGDGHERGQKNFTLSVHGDGVTIIAVHPGFAERHAGALIGADFAHRNEVRFQFRHLLQVHHRLHPIFWWPAPVRVMYRDRFEPV
ncbi:hypothetical protein [Cryobacterium glaciale]|uniref:hypothetical protein n=1 Tax=Cryobacterium glaciale TaxID=1259145 RepID=UPI00141A874A|nr:hypothetical protein [Cryobacterium glaciale]